LIVCDTSVLVAAFARWHDAHREAVAALARVGGLVEHTVLETFSVLTRLPAPRRAPPELVALFHGHHFPDVVPRLSGPGPEAVIEAARARGVVGGAVYDLLVGLAAAHADATLLSLDRRALATYRAAEVRCELLSTT